MVLGELWQNKIEYANSRTFPTLLKHTVCSNTWTRRCENLYFRSHFYSGISLLRTISHMQKLKH